MKQIILKIEGMTCSACSLGLEKFLNKQDGIIEANVNLVLAIATIKYENIDVNIINEYIKKSGFKSNGEFTGIDDTEEESRLFLIIAGVLLVVTMLLMFIKFNILLKSSIMLLISIIFLIYGKDILINGIKNFIHRMPNMDSLVFLSVSSSFFYSLYGYINILLKNDTKLYFESICMIIFFIKLGRYIELKCLDKTKNAIKELVQITPTKATIKVNDVFKYVSIDEIKVGDIIVCRPYEKIAVDGIVTSSKTYVDESFITGESEPVLKEEGSLVLAGSINYNNVIEYKAKNIGKDSTISEIVKLVIEATNSKNRIQRLTDKVSGYFIIGVIFIALITFGLVLFCQGLEQAIFRFATVLVVACPCALGLSVPLVMVVSNGLCARNGLLLRNSDVLERSQKIDTVVFDKTGTLTYGKLKIYDFYNYSDYKNEELLNIVANIESLSTHPLGKAFSIKSKKDVSNFFMIDGIGVSGEIDGNKYYLGNEKVLKKLNIKDKKEKDLEKLLNNACSIIYVVENNKIISLIGVKDIVRNESKKVIKELKRRDINVVMLTGDNEKTANIIANDIGIELVYANVLPKEKVNIIKNLMNNSNGVIMVGDGINDAPALMNATIGISVMEGTDIANYSSSVILVNNDIKNIINLLNLSKASYKIIKQNLFFAFGYNICMIPIAIGLFEFINIGINPMIASIMMTLSSLTVLVNSLRLGRMKI